MAELLPLHVIGGHRRHPGRRRAAVFDDTKAMLQSWDPESGVPKAQSQDAQMRLLRYAHVLARPPGRPEDDVGRSWWRPS